MTDLQVADLLDQAAAEIEANPGRNALDAICDATRGMPQHERDVLVGVAYHRLKDYLPPHVASLARWSDTETSDRVAGKLRQLAKTTRRGGPAHVDAHPEPHLEPPPRAPA